MRTPNPSKLGPCSKFEISRTSKFCDRCGHTSGKHVWIVDQYGSVFIVKKRFSSPGKQTFDFTVEDDAKAEARRLNKEAAAAALARLGGWGGDPGV